MLCLLGLLRCAPHAVPAVQEEFDFEEALKKFNKGQLGKEAGEEHVSGDGGWWGVSIHGWGLCCPQRSAFLQSAWVAWLLLPGSCCQLLPCGGM